MIPALAVGSPRAGRTYRALTAQLAGCMTEARYFFNFSKSSSGKIWKYLAITPAGVIGGGKSLRNVPCECERPARPWPACKYICLYLEEMEKLLNSLVQGQMSLLAVIKIPFLSKGSNKKITFIEISIILKE